MKKKNNKIAVDFFKKNKEKKRNFDEVINATSYQALIPSPSPLDINVVYQVCLALVYKHKVQPLPEKPFSFIVMDGGFPCLMPYDDRVDRSKPVAKYILTNAQYTQHSFDTTDEAHEFLAKLKLARDTYVDTEVKKKCETEILRFYPSFLKEFKYKGWQGTVLCKPITETELRCSATYKNEMGVIAITPGKVSEISAVAKEVKELILNKSIITEGQYSYVKNGVLKRARKEFTTRPEKGSVGNVYELKPFSDYSAKVYQKTCFTGQSFWQRRLPSFSNDVCLRAKKGFAHV